MNLRFRQMQPKDVASCANIVFSNPIHRARYGRAAAQLEQAWLLLLGCEAFTAVVFEEWLGDHPRLVGCGASVFVSDAFVRELKSPPSFWIGPELARRVCLGVSPLLSNKEVAEANARDGLNLVGWHAASGPEDGRRVDVLNFLFATFLEVHRGFLVKELIGQAESEEMARSMWNIGNSFFDPNRGCFVDSIDGSAEEFVRRPHVVGSKRDQALAKPGLWVASVFAYQPPRFAFRRSEQKLLLAALRGETDEELSDELAVSLSSVRRMWLSIYDRVAANLPTLFRDEVPANDGISGRGRGKKHRLLAYIREHPEELRPVSRRRLANSIGDPG
jgi:hypothetical protein